MMEGPMQRTVGIAAALLACMLARGAVAQDGSFQWQATGAATYYTVCATCHQTTGLGLPGTFPPLAGHAAAILARQGGRAYLEHVVLYGLEGEITVDGKTFNG